MSKDNLLGCAVEPSGFEQCRDIVAALVRELRGDARHGAMLALDAIAKAMIGTRASPPPLAVGNRVTYGGNDFRIVGTETHYRLAADDYPDGAYIVIGADRLAPTKSDAPYFRRCRCGKYEFGPNDVKIEGSDGSFHYTKFECSLPAETSAPLPCLHKFTRIGVRGEFVPDLDQVCEGGCGKTYEQITKEMRETKKPRGADRLAPTKPDAPYVMKLSEEAAFGKALLRSSRRVPDDDGSKPAGETSAFKPNSQCKSYDACRREQVCLDGWHCASSISSEQR